MGQQYWVSPFVVPRLSYGEAGTGHEVEDLGRLEGKLVRVKIAAAGYIMIEEVIEEVIEEENQTGQEPAKRGRLPEWIHKKLWGGEDMKRDEAAAWVGQIARVIAQITNDNEGVPREASSRCLAHKGWEKVLKFTKGFDAVKFKKACGLD